MYWIQVHLYVIILLGCVGQAATLLDGQFSHVRLDFNMYWYNENSSHTTMTDHRSVKFNSLRTENMVIDVQQVYESKSKF